MMKSFLVIIALLSLAAAQGAEDGLPQCAKLCVNSFTSGQDIGGCRQSDYACICSNPNFLSGIACCLAAPGSCDPADQTVAVNYAHSFCALVKVTNLPASVTCSSTSSAVVASTTGAANNSTTSGPASVTAISTSASHSSSATPNSGSYNAGRVGAAILGAAAVLL